VTFVQPRPIEERDVLTPFDCGVEDLNQWLVQRSLRAHRRGSARTYVVFGDDGLLAGYLAPAATGVGRERGPFHRDMPDPVPAVLLARLAVATGAQGRGLGRALVEHAWRTCQAVSEQIGVRGLLVDATDENATRFYRSCDFVPIATGQPTLARILTG
jgi:GNAT superfamily N-acetyltransferase